MKEHCYVCGGELHDGDEIVALRDEDPSVGYAVELFVHGRCMSAFERADA